MLFTRSTRKDNMPNGYNIGYQAAEKELYPSLAYAVAYIEVLERQLADYKRKYGDCVETRDHGYSVVRGWFDTSAGSDEQSSDSNNECRYRDGKIEV